MRKRLWSLIPFFVFVMILFGFSMKPISAEEVTPQETEEITETTQVQPEQANDPAQVETATESQGQGDSANAQPNAQSTNAVEETKLQTNEASPRNISGNLNTDTVTWDDGADIVVSQSGIIYPKGTLTIDGSTILVDNPWAKPGYTGQKPAFVVVQRSNGKIILKDVTLTQQGSGERYLIITQDNKAAFELLNTIINLGEAAGAEGKGIIWVTQGSTGEFNNVTINGDILDSGYRRNHGNVIKVGGTNNNANATGGKLTFKGNNTINNVYGTIENLGQMIIESGTTTIKDSMIVFQSGGFTVKSGATLKILNSHILLHKLGDGTAIYVEQGGTLIVDEKSNIRDGSGSNPEGFIVVDGGIMTVKNSTIQTRRNQWNGGQQFKRNIIHLKNGATLNMDNVDFHHNTSVYGAIGANNATINLNNVRAVQNYAIHGAVLNAKNVVLNVDNCRFAANTSGGKGDGGVFRLENANATISNTVFEDNNGGNWGGAIVQNGGTLDVDHSTFKNNHAMHGGAILAYDTALTIKNGTVFDGNQATGDPDWYDQGKGGAIAIDIANSTMEPGAASLMIEDATFTGNKATTAGGALCIGGLTHHHYWDWDASGKTIKNPYYVQKGVVAEIKKALIERNSVTQSNTDEGGGGIYIGDDGYLKLSNVLITENTAEGAGGGIYSCGTSSSIQLDTAGSAIYDNTGQKGDVYLQDKHAQTGIQRPHEIKEFMLGGGSHNWTKEDVPNSYRPDFEDAEGKTTGESYTANASGKEKAEAKATVIIRYNSCIVGDWPPSQDDGQGGYAVMAGNGGGITNNGLMEIEGYVGGFEVRKNVEAEGRKNLDQEFEFTIELDNKNVNGSTNIDTGEAYGVNFTNGVATFKLKDGESMAINNLPTGIKYTVTEGDYRQSGYYQTDVHYDHENDIVTFTNKYAVVDVKVDKKWDDENNRDGIRPKSITYHVLRDGEVYAEVIVDKTTDYSFSMIGLPKYHDGVEYVYAVEEVAVEGYESIVSGDLKNGYVFTNRHEVELIEILVKKIWNDFDNANGTRPDSITFHLYANGKEVELTLNKLTAAGGWEIIIEDLPKYDNGEEIEYTLTEESVDGYETEITGNAEDGFTIINTLKTVGKKKVYGVQTGMENLSAIYSVFASISLAGVALIRSRKH